MTFDYGLMIVLPSELRRSIEAAPEGGKKPKRGSKGGVNTAIVYEKKHIQENCSTCLYGPNALRYDGTPVGRMGCANANRLEDYMRYLLFGGCCPSYYLDFNRYEEKRE